MTIRHVATKISRTLWFVFRVVVTSWLVVSVTGVSAVDPEIRTIEKGFDSSIDSKREAVARTEAEWTALWKAHNFDRPAPKVDFSKEMVVAVFIGSRPTAGFGVEIVKAAQRDGSLVVTYKTTRPAPGTVTAQILTSPYHIAAVPKRTGDVRFETATDR